ncbi:hypothetical protein Tco_0647601 [Tanacetum coccineum]
MESSSSPTPSPPKPPQPTPTTITSPLLTTAAATRSVTPPPPPPQPPHNKGALGLSAAQQHKKKNNTRKRWFGLFLRRAPRVRGGSRKRKGADYWFSSGSRREQRGTVNMGLWYPKDTAMARTAYADADHAGCPDTHRTVHLQRSVPCDKLVIWSSKSKQALHLAIRKAGSYKCQLDEQWFNLSQDTLRDALQITPVDNNRAFSSPPTPDTLVEFVNKLLYLKWPRAPALQILWGIVNRAHIDYAERMWEEFSQSIHTFTEDKRKLAQHTLGKKKATLILIPSIRFTKLIIFHLQRLHNFHPRPETPTPILPTEEPVPRSSQVTVLRGKQIRRVPTAKPSLEDTEEAILQKSDEEMPSVIRSGAQDEGQAGPDPGTLDEGQAGPNPDVINTAESLPLPTPCVLAGPNLEHSDENLKLTVDEQVIPEEPVSSTGTLSSLQHLAKDFSFGDQFLNDKPSEADNEKSQQHELESMVSVTIQQDTSVIPPMTSPVIDLVSRPDSPNVHWPLPTTTTTTAAPTTITTTTLPLPPQPQQGSSDSILIKRMGELEQHIANLAEENQALETRLDKQGNRIHKVETMDWPKMIREQTVEFIESQEIDRKINETVKEVVTSSVKHAMRAPLRARFKDLSLF